MNTPQTAEQHNLPITGKVDIYQTPLHIEPLHINIHWILEEKIERQRKAINLARFCIINGWDDLAKVALEKEL